MIVLPPVITPPAPFPLVISQWSSPDVVAPGIRRADYRLTTNAGPLVIHVVAIDTHDPRVHLGAVLARDRMISNGETVSSMAARSGAVAGINADYFDIGNTNQPLNVVVRDGALLRTPSKRVAIDVATTGAVGIGYVAFNGTAAYGTVNMPLTGINEWPPQGGAALLTPAYGALGAPAANVIAATLAPLDVTPGQPPAYRVTAVGVPPAGPVTAPLLGFGPAAQRIAPPPLPGDTVTLTYGTIPDAASLLAAVGGGPLLVAGGVAVDDPFSPAPEERNVRFPVAGAALESDGTLLLIVADGRKTAVSIGLTRPEFGALMRGFGATDGLAFDSGGSATLVARALGDTAASVVNDPSDGRERPVADGLFAYSDAPAGLHPHLIVRPATFTVYRGATVALRGAIVDDAGNRVRAAEIPPLVTDPAIGAHTAVVRDASGATATVPYHVVDRVAALTIAPDRPNPPRDTSVPFSVTASDERGAPILLGSDAPVRWMLGPQPASGSHAVYETDRGDATIAATLGSATATTLIRVGDHTVAVPAYPETVLPYDFTGSARAAYANGIIALPDEPVRMSLEVFGDGNGVPLRASFLNRYGEKSLLTLAKSVDWTGWRRISIALPPDLNPPVRLTSVYVVRSLGGAPVTAAGDVADARTHRRDSGELVMRRVLIAVLIALTVGAADAAARAAAPIGVPVLMYHKVDPQLPRDAVGRSLTLTPAAFAAQLSWLRKHGIRTLTMNELADALLRGDHPRNAVVLTFDDGYSDAAEVVTPILQKFGAHASFYVSAGFIGDGRHAGWAQLRTMHAAGMEIGCHGTHHLDLTRIKPAEASYEVQHCVAALTKYIARPTTYVYAAGKWNATALALMRRTGMKAALTERPGDVTTLTSPYTLPRRRIDRSTGIASFAALATP